MARADLAHLAGEALPLIVGTDGRRDELQAALAAEHRGSLFERGVLVLDENGATVASAFAPGLVPELGAELPSLVRQARSLDRAVVSALLPSEKGVPPFLLFVGPVRGAAGVPVGFVAGVLHAARTPVVTALVGARAGGQAELEIVDRKGVVVASSSPARLYRQADHGSVLAGAIGTHRPLRGRCHNCHEGEDSRPSRATEVLAFSALPTLALGVAVHEPESSALAPALALRSRIGLMGGTFASLFLLFAGLSVRSVVRPITRLTRHVHGLETGDTRRSLPLLGHDEVGELSGAMERWRSRLTGTTRWTTSVAAHTTS